MGMHAYYHNSQATVILALYIWLPRCLIHIQIFSEKLHKRISNYRVFSIKDTNVAKHSIECMHLSKPFNVEYSVSLRCKSMTEPKTRVFHVICLSISSFYAPQSSQKKLKTKTMPPSKRPVWIKNTLYVVVFFFQHFLSPPLFMYLTHNETRPQHIGKLSCFLIANSNCSIRDNQQHDPWSSLS